MVMVHDYYSPNSFFKELNKRVLVLWSPFLISRTLEIAHSRSPKITEKNTTSTIFMESRASDKIWFILFIVIHSHMIHIHELIHSHEFHIHTHINSQTLQILVILLIVIHSHIFHIHELIHSHTVHEHHTHIHINSWTLKLISQSCSQS